MLGQRAKWDKRNQQQGQNNKPKTICRSNGVLHDYIIEIKEGKLAWGKRGEGLNLLL